ncbi:MAG: cytochrome C oxidase subunit IV family protein [Deltaproteobacteria bacterium]|nr:cytochrome C oxidase subunit IV family protein [Deltaproteobacteria bacterium]
MEKPLEARTYLWTWAALIVLTAATFGLSHVELGGISTAIGLIIAVAKAALIGLVFMGLLRADFTMRFVPAAALMTLLLLLLVVTLDVTTRSPLARPLGSGYQSEKSMPSLPRKPPSASSSRPGSK